MSVSDGITLVASFRQTHVKASIDGQLAANWLSVVVSSWFSEWVRIAGVTLLAVGHTSSLGNEK